MEDAGEAHRLTVLLAERHDLLDLDLPVAHLDPVRAVVVRDLHRDALHAQLLADERPKRLHRPTELAAEDCRELLRLLV